MVEHTATAGTKKRGVFSSLGAAIKHTTVRIYALAILMVVVWTGYTAVAFLVRSVFKPTQVPAQFLSWQTALSSGKLKSDASVSEVSVPRAPMEHYHGISRTLPADPGNGCTTSGCHGALAHTKRKEIRAFANLHATFLACTMCHDASIDGPTEAMWVSIETGEPSGVPAALELMKHFETDAAKMQSAPAEFNAWIAESLPRISRVSRDPAIDYLQAEINTSEPGSPVWRHSVEQLASELPNHLRGEYGSKLAKKVAGDEQRRYNQHLVELAQQYRASSDSIPERKKLHDEIHKGILVKPSACLACHGGEPARLNFEALGYSAQRAAALRDSALARQMQSILKGEPFYLPKLLEGGNAR